MSTQPLQKLNLLQPNEQTDSSVGRSPFIPGLEAIKDFPKGKVLSYLTDPVPGSHTQDLYGELTRETTKLRGLSAPPILFPKVRIHPQDYFVSLQKWEGVVLQVMEDSFLARLIDLTHKEPDEEAEIPIEEISEEDSDLLKPGAVFYWNIGYLDKYSGQRARASVIRFRRLPAWSQEEIRAAENEAKRIRGFIGWK